MRAFLLGKSRVKRGMPAARPVTRRQSLACRARWLLTALLLWVAQPTVAIEPRRARDVGQLRLVATPDGRLQTWSLRNPAQPMLIDARQVGGVVVDVHVAEGLLVAVVVARRTVVLRLQPDGGLSEYRPTLLPGEATLAVATGEGPRSGRRILGRVVGA